MDQMTQEQWKKLEVLERLNEGAVTQADAARVLGLCERQVRRLAARFEENGKACLVHGNVGRSPGNRLKEASRDKIIALRRDVYEGFNDHHFTEKLAEAHKIKVSRPSVRRLLRAAGIASPQTRRGRKLRRRRERRAQMGMMLLWDGSPHAWLEDRGPMLCLVGAIDDATGELMPGAHFVEQECAVAYLRVLLAICKAHGIPLSIYMDRHSSLKRHDSFWTLDEELKGSQEATQVGRALEELGIEAIYALSPQAKGRVERMWRTLQDRLVSELRLVGAKTMAEANRELTAYRPKFNRRFGVKSREPEKAWRPVAGSLDLTEICGFRTEATVNPDNTVQKNGVRVDLKAGPNGTSLAGKRAVIRQRLNGEIRVYVDGTRQGILRAAPPSHAPRRTRVRPQVRTHGHQHQTRPPRKDKLTFKQSLQKYRGSDRTKSLTS
jgi:transposase